MTTPLGATVEGRQGSREFGAGPVPKLVALLVIVVALGASLIAAGVSAALFVGPIAVVIVAAWATQRPTRAAFLSMVAIAIVPVYWSPVLPGTQIPTLPAVVAATVVLPAAMRRRNDVHLNGIDRLFVAYIFFRLASFLVNPSAGIGLAVDTVAQVILPYAAFRILSTQPGIRAALALGVVTGGVLSAVIAIREYNGVPNPFLDRRFGGYQYAYYTRVDARFGRPRPEAAFGQAIPLGMFLVLAAVLALAFAWRASSRSRRLLSYAAVLVILVGLSNTLVRGPLVMLAVAVFVVLAGDVQRIRLDRTLLVVVAGLALLTVGSLGANIYKLRDATVEPGPVRDSGNVRFQIFSAVSKSENFSVLGKRGDAGREVGFQRDVGQQVGLGTFENAFALTYLGYGVFALLAFTGMALLVIRAGFMSGLTTLDRGWCAALVGVFVNLVGVGLVSQFAQVFWICLAVVASIVHSASDRKHLSSETVA